MTKEEILEWIDDNINTTKPSPSKAYPIDNIKFDNSGVSFMADISVNIYTFETMIPFKINRVAASFGIHSVTIDTLENAPDYVGYMFYLNNCPITSLKYLPKYIGSDIYFDGLNKLKDPYEYRYILYSDIGKVGSLVDVHQLFEDKEVETIIKEFYGKHNRYHQAIEQLIDLGEARGFHYD